MCRGGPQLLWVSTARLALHAPTNKRNGRGDSGANHVCRKGTANRAATTRAVRLPLITELAPGCQS